MSHREDGPAMENSNAKYWCKNGKLHREDGPAVEYKDEYIEHQYYINGNQISEEKFNFEKELRKSIKNTRLNQKNKI